MLYRSLTAAFALAAALMVTTGGAQAADDAKYPNWKGQWDTINPRLGGQVIKFDPTKAWGPAQQAPLTPEYQMVLEDTVRLKTSSSPPPLGRGSSPPRWSSIVRSTRD